MRIPFDRLTVSPFRRMYEHMGLARWWNRIVRFPPLSAGDFDVLDRWEHEVVPGVLALARELAPIPPLEEIFSFTRLIRARGDPYLAYRFLRLLAERVPHDPTRHTLRARAALYACTYGLYTRAYEEIQPFLMDERVAPEARVYACRVASLYHEKQGNWDEAFRWNREEERLIQHHARSSPLIAGREGVVVLNRVHLLLKRFRGESHDRAPGREAMMHALVQNLRRFYRRRHTVEGWSTFAWSVLMEAYLFSGNYDRARRLLNFFDRQEVEVSDELRAALKLYRAILEYLQGRTDTVLESIQEALVYAMVSGAFFREWDTLDMALQLVRRMGSRREALEDLALGQYFPFLQALLALLEKKDQYTARDHSLRVSWLAYQIARDMVATHPRYARFVFPRVLAVTGLLHDVGKLYLPWILLNRLNRFTGEERILIQRHVGEGVRVLRHLAISGLAPILAEHHERLDGSGYPAGLRGDEISMMGAILAVADTFEAATSPNRRYRPPKSPEEILSEMGKGGYHPLVLEILGRLLEHRLEYPASVEAWMQDLRTGNTA